MAAAPRGSRDHVLPPALALLQVLHLKCQRFVFFFLLLIFFGWPSDGRVPNRPRPWRAPSWSPGSGGATEQLLSSSLGLSEKLPHPIIISIYGKSFIKRSNPNPQGRVAICRMARRRYQAGLTAGFLLACLLASLQDVFEIYVNPTKQTDSSRN